MLTSRCPHCDYEKKTILPKKIPIINLYIGAWWAGYWVGRHFSKNHPQKYIDFKTGGLEEYVRWYIAQPYLPLKERYEKMDKEEAVREVVAILETGRGLDDVMCSEHKETNQERP